jgi:bacillithiol biosynthesis cysteine-adding enzyme BshC
MEVLRETSFKVTANDSSLSDTARPDLSNVDLLATGRFPPLVEAFLRGQDLELLTPVRFLRPDNEPAGDCRSTAPDRRNLALSLQTANEGYGHPVASELAGSLADPATRVVITGQQPGLFGGPLYTLSKAVAVSLWAERLRAAGQPAVALFWMATEDHDFRESAGASFPTAQGLRRFDLGEDQEPLVPVGLRELGAGVTEILSELHEAIPGDRYGEWLDEIGAWYTPEARFGEAFARLMVRMLGERCPLLVDAQLAGLKEAQRPWLRQIVEQRTALGKAFDQRDGAITEAGFPLQVRPQPGTSPLFLQAGRQRLRIEWRTPERFGLRGDPEFENDVEWLLAVIDKEPERISPGVRARSAIQDAVFGTCLQVLGPGELSYMPQVAPLFELLDIPAPWVTLRPQMLVLDERQRAKLSDTGIGFESLVDPALDLETVLARAEDTKFLSGAEQTLEQLLERLKGPALELDPQLENPWKKTADQMHKALQMFGNRVTSSAANRNAIAKGRLEALRELCLPGGQFQERVIASCHFPGKYGQGFVEAMFEQMHLEPTTLQVVAPYQANRMKGEEIGT